MSNEDVPVRRRRARYTPEFKEDAVAMVLDTGRTIAEVARGLGVGDQTLGTWVKQARIDRGQCEGVSSGTVTLLKSTTWENLWCEHRNTSTATRSRSSTTMYG